MYPYNVEIADTALNILMRDELVEAREEREVDEFAHPVSNVLRNN